MYVDTDTRNTTGDINKTVTESSPERICATSGAFSSQHKGAFVTLFVAANVAVEENFLKQRWTPLSKIGLCHARPNSDVFTKRRRPRNN